ncbi:MAG: hypothetical protein RL172_3058 [Bacteroidota bacterium]|jgi:hypothetical protein
MGTKQKPLNEMTLEELTVREKATKTSIAVMAVAIAIMAITGVYITIKNGFSVFTVMPIIFLSLLFVNVGVLKKIRQEIAAKQ